MLEKERGDGMTYDCLIIGGGPAGLSAALQCKALGLSALLIGNPHHQNPLGKAERVDNYLGLPGLTGNELMDAFQRHVAEGQAAEMVIGRVMNAMAYGDSFAVNVGSEVYQSKSVILATGVSRGRKYSGEEALLGRGVSYCAVCDGMLYRNRDIVVVGLAQDAAEEAQFLAKMGCHVTFLAPTKPAGLPDDIPYIKARKLEILGEDRVTAIRTEDGECSCDGVFILRDTVAPTSLFPGLALEGGYIKVEADMSTNLPGVFACGDCTGLPLQIAKAVGEGQKAAHSAKVWLENKADAKR